MKYTKLGKSNLNVSKVCLGCMGFGNPQTGHYVPHELVGVMAQNDKQKSGNVV